MNKQDQELYNQILARRAAIEGAEAAYQLAEVEEDAFGQIEAIRVHEQILGKKPPHIEPVQDPDTKLWSVVVPSGFPNSTRGAQVFRAVSLESLVTALATAQFFATAHIIRQGRALKDKMDFKPDLVCGPNPMDHF